MLLIESIKVITFFLLQMMTLPYANKIYRVKDWKIATCCIIAILNTLALGVASQLPFGEPIGMIVMVVLLTLEIKYLNRERVLKAAFFSLGFCVNFFAIRLLVFSVCAIVNKASVAAIAGQSYLYNVCTIVGVVLTILYMLLVQRFLPKKILDMINSSSQNIYFAVQILTAIYVYQSVNSINFYFTDHYPFLVFLQLKVAVCAILGFLLALLYTYLLSCLVLFENHSDTMQKNLKEQKQINENLKNMAYYDPFTDCYNRRYGMEYLEGSIHINRSVFSVLFFDLDGLKAVNDRFGHHEGDEYILAMVNVFKNVFQQDCICRMGGDEFMVILRGCDEYDAAKYAMQIMQTIEMMGKHTIKQYQCSVSYGILAVYAKSEYSAQEILEIVDKRMYVHKNNNRKGRSLWKK